VRGFTYPPIPTPFPFINFKKSFFFLQFYLVMKGHGKNEETSLASKNGPGKFVAAKIRAAHTSLSQQSNQQITGIAASDASRLTDKDLQVITHLFRFEILNK
jgi:hypothetical protein